MESVHINVPSECHLWQKQGITKDEIRASLERVKEYFDYSDHTRQLLKCKSCGQLYLFESYEIEDWAAGSGQEYRTWIPADSVAHADKLNDLSQYEFLALTSLRMDIPPLGDKPAAPYWKIF